ncbi:MAG TPA: hypothetical protein VNQ73_21265 [Ilumatobacter sp.]|nr:hypothetical protein [Ilumatobacter sp.]
MQVPRSDGLLPDRFVEIDLDWFPPGDGRAVEEFVERTVPLWAGQRGERGVVLNTGFLVDVLTEFTGALDQPLPLRSRRYATWRERSYGDLRRLAADVRSAAARHGIADLRVGVLVAGVGRVLTGTDLYDLHSDWCDRHPELYPFDLSPLPGPDLDPRVPLAADTYPYASRPGGVVAGTPFAELLADQWAAVAAACELDVIHLRDGFWGPMLYTRRGPYGVTAGPDPTENASWTVAISDLFAAVKQRRPESTVMAYTSGIGATAEWRCGCVDTEAVLRGGGVDVLIDQTWGGAWQDWWDDWWKGWTNQHANLLSHAVAVRGSGQPVRHYKLIETWDGWEPFDTVHSVPGKLRWAMWAWSHAAVVTPTGLEVPDGAYVSWMNDKDRRLLDAEAVAFVADELGAAEASASRMTAVGGPLLVFDRAAVAARHRDQPRVNGSEHVEDAAALLLKWGAPILGATRAEWLGRVDAGNGAVVQLGGGAPDASDAGGPVLLVGRADAVSAELLAEAGCAVPGGDSVADPVPGYHREWVADPGVPSGGWVQLAGQTAVEARPEADVLATAAGRPTLAAAGGGTAWWQPPELADPSNPLLPRSQYGSVASAAVAARWLSAHGRGVTVEPVPYPSPVTVQWWQAGDERWVLAGNLEAGWVGDARFARSVVVHSDGGQRIELDVPAEGCAVAQLPVAAAVSS